MKIKSVLLAGLVSAAGAISLSAAEVYSVNAVGFVNVTVPAGQFQIVGNPLNQADNTLPTILPAVPVGTRVFKFNAGGSSFTTFTKLAGGWSPTAESATTAFNPGEGFFVKAPAGANLTLTFVGEVAQGAALTISVPIGFSLIAPHVPQSASLETELGLAARQGDRVYFFRNGAYAIATRLASTWTASTGVLDVNGQPRPDVGEGFFFQNKQVAPITWVRSFSANN